MSNTATTGLQPLASCIHLDADGKPYLRGFQCSSCQEVFLDHRRGCPKCAAVNSLQPKRLSERGSLFSFTIVHRSYPKVPTPFISVVVELDGGGFIKGNLLGVEPVPEKVQFNMPVRLRFDRLTGDTDGQVLLRYHFVPVEDSRE
jgi:uncharacterized OB-fold protein